jgi:oligopeptide/dipeptide ABC transporter ATP-binding protein
MSAAARLLEVRDLEIVFDTPDAKVHAVRGVSFDIGVEETVGIVGESGCGKSVTAMSLLRFVDRPGRIAGGSIRFEGRDILAMSNEEIRNLRGNRISMVFQDPMTSLNPVLTIGRQIEDVMRSHSRRDRRERRAATIELLASVGIPDADKRVDDYPHQFSGGMRQRGMIAMALANRPSVIVADEPTTALDVTVQAQILDLLRDLNRTLGTSIVLISHDLRVVAELCRRILVFYAGRIVEEGTPDEVFSDPRHPYTRALLRSVPQGDAVDRRPLAVIPGMPPSLAPPPVGCAFRPRCDVSFERCVDDPPLIPVGNGRSAACWHCLENAVSEDATARSSR